MGIQDRDYMKRRRDDDDDRGDRRSASPMGDGVDAQVARFIQKNSRLFKFAGVALGVLLLVVIALAMVSDKGH